MALSQLPPRRPRQLPPPPLSFIGTEPHLATITALADQALAHNRTQVVVLAGMPGSGKTSLVTAWAWINRERFGGGQLYVDLQPYRDRESGMVVLIDVMGRFLRGLGMCDDRQPAGIVARAAVFRDLTADQPVLVVIDNADQAAQARLFVPTAGGSVVLVTSRHRLSGLVMDGACTIDLAPPHAPDVDGRG